MYRRPNYGYVSLLLVSNYVIICYMSLAGCISLVKCVYMDIVMSMFMSL